MNEHAGNLGEMGRRSFLQLLAGAALATQGCSRPRQLVPYVTAPEHASATYATSLPFRGFGRGVLVETTNGRPTGLTGNPRHPASLGGADIFMFASLLDLYDPRRRFGTKVSPLGPLERVAFLSRPVRSPQLDEQRRKLLARYPLARWFVHDPWPVGLKGFSHLVHDHPRLKGVVVSFEADFLSEHPDKLRLARELAGTRRYAFESTPTITGVKAHHRVALSPPLCEQVLWALARRLGVHAHDGPEHDLVETIAGELTSQGGVVLAGEWLSPEAHVLAYRINARFGNVTYSQEEREPGLDELFASPWDRLIVLEGDPFLEAPDRDWAGFPRRTHLTLFPTAGADEMVALAHPLESWGDLRSYGGVLDVVQPLVEPLFGGVSATQFLAQLMGESYRPVVPDAEVLRRGFHEGEPARGTPVPVAVPFNPPEEPRRTLVLVRPDPHLGDYGWSHNAWLQELPRPISKLCWGQAAMVPADMLNRGEHTSLGAPAFPLEGQAHDCVTLWMGPAAYAASDTAVVTRAAGHTDLVTTQDHFRLEQPLGGHPPSETVYPRHPAGPVAWGMVIDLAACIGCNTCVLACQAENNVATVGEEQVRKGREMHWLRVDRYEDEFVPIPCMQCEDAPCERVCPVEATVHSRDGLNDMVYNRCVGTRYCSNNCPYKVRRFNFLAWPEPLVQNPEVTVRERGVMEKCTYCVQRIRKTEIAARTEHEPMGTVTTACQDACPTRAIAFGNLADPASDVARLAQDPRNFSMLASLNTRPRTTYLR